MYRPRKILIVEDDPISAQLYRTALERAGFLVEQAATGRDGFERIQRSIPDGILLDLMLPQMNGIELLKAIRAQHHLVRVPVIAYTNAFIPSFIEAATAAGATEVHSKSKLTPPILIRAFDGTIPA